jgi:hypothetical protein
MGGIKVRGYMKHAAKVVSGAVMYIPSFIKNDSGIRKPVSGIHQRHTDIISLFPFDRIRKMR